MSRRYRYSTNQLVYIQHIFNIYSTYNKISEKLAEHARKLVIAES